VRAPVGHAYADASILEGLTVASISPVMCQSMREEKGSAAGRSRVTRPIVAGSSVARKGGSRVHRPGFPLAGSQSDPECFQTRPGARPGGERSQRDLIRTSPGQLHQAEPVSQCHHCIMPMAVSGCDHQCLVEILEVIISTGDREGLREAMIPSGSVQHGTNQPEMPLAAIRLPCFPTHMQSVFSPFRDALAPQPTRDPPP